MTIGLLLAGLGVLVWPAHRDDAQRIRLLQARLRLAPVRPGRPGLGALLLSRARPEGSPVAPVTMASAGVVVVVAAVASGAGALVLIEFAAVALPVGLIGASLTRRSLRRRRRDRRSAEVLLALGLLAGELEAGAPLPKALAGAGSVGTEIERHLADDSDPERDDPLARVVLAARVSARTGVALAELLARARCDLAAAVDARRELRIVLAGPRASATVLALLPILGVALGSAMGAHPLSTFVGTAPGRLLLAVGVLLDAAGVAWTAQLIAGAER